MKSVSTRLVKSYAAFVSVWPSIDPRQAQERRDWLSPCEVLPEIHSAAGAAACSAAWNMHDTVIGLNPHERVAKLYSLVGASQAFVDGVVWLWVLYEGRELYHAKHSHYPVDMHGFAHWAFNNNKDTLEFLLDMEI